MHLPPQHVLIVLADAYSVYSVGGGLGRARGASRRGLLFSSFSRKICWFGPDSLAHIITANSRANLDSIARSIEHQEGSMLYILVAVPQESDYATQPNSNVSPHLKHKRQ